MRNLLSSSTLRQLCFLENLLAADDWLPASKLAEELGCSLRVLRNDITTINTDFAPFHIDSSKKFGIILHYPENYAIDFIYGRILSNSPEFNFLELIFLNETLSITDLSNRLFISPSTLIRLIKKVKKILLPLGIEIETSPYRFIGNEAAIRNLFVHLLMEKYPTSDLPFSSSQLEAVDSFIYYIGREADILLNYPDIKQIRAIIIVNVTRIINGHSKETASLSEQQDKLIKGIIANPIITQSFFKNYHIKLSEHIIKEIFSVFLNQEFATDINHLEKKRSQDNGKVNEVIQNIESFLNRLSLRLGIPLKNKNKLTLELYNIQQLFLGPNFILFDRKKQFMAYAKEEYPAFVELLAEELQSFKFYSAFEWSDAALNETVYLLIIHWTDLPSELEKTLVPLKIGLFCDYDSEHTLLIRDLIYFHFSKHVCVTALTALSEEKAMKESQQYDIIITNLSGLILDCSRVICINSIPSMHDWKNLQHHILAKSTEPTFMTTKFINS